MPKLAKIERNRPDNKIQNPKRKVGEIVTREIYVAWEENPDETWLTTSEDFQNRRLAKPKEITLENMADMLNRKQRMETITTSAERAKASATIMLKAGRRAATKDDA